MESTAYLQPTQIVEERKETELTKSMKRQFPLFGLGSLLYSLFYAFCLYKNASGITYPFFVIGTLYFFFFCMRKLGVPFKKDSVFYIVSVVLLGLSNCMTASLPLLFMNKCGIFFLTVTLMLHTIYRDESWNFPKYFSAVFRTAGGVFACLLRPFSDMISYFDAQKQEKADKKIYFLPVLTGICIAIPLLLLITMLLASADVIFDNIFGSIIENLNISNIFKIFILMVTVFFFSYAVFATLCKKGIQEETKDKRHFDPVVAIVVTSLLGVLYLLFCGIQILYLFIGNMTLPDGYTYARYAREGFFQLLAVCIINLILVLMCLGLFRESRVLKGILTVICGCTFIMIFSSALRMILYIDTYSLTFLRVFVLWSLAVIFALMAGVTVSIFHKRFPLFLYGTITVTVCYLILSFAHPDYWIARYNLNYSGKMYLSELSADAAPVILNPSVNPDLISVEDMLEKTAYDPNISNVRSRDYDDDYYDSYWMKSFYCKMEDDTRGMGIRTFNFSLYQAKKYMEH